ncbi:host-nuclease inhibitor Gam family protein [Riemerella anatipestifer]|nr:host-nuclease inhibitor Gam family protein [Riemerella anatipestifer]
MNKEIVEVAETYQKIDRQIKDLQSKQKPLKKQLIDYAEEHKSDFDEAFQLKFPNGTYISQRVSDVIEGSNEAKTAIT